MDIIGKNGVCKIATDFVEESALKQLYALMNSPVTEGVQVRVMPDVHAGTGCTIGTSLLIRDTDKAKIVPTHVGVDIGCGVLSTRLKVKNLDLNKLDEIVTTKVPNGFSIHTTETSPLIKYKNDKKIEYHLSQIKAPVNVQKAILSCGSLGGGNHFIEVDKDEDGYVYLQIHCGSRHLGLEIAQYYQKKAVEYCTKEIGVKVQSDMAYLEGELLENYIHDMRIAQGFAHLNRVTVSNIITKELSLKLDIWSEYNTTHNYIEENCPEDDTVKYIVRKGAVSAYKDQILFIPLNMRDGTLLCKGKGNADWNYTAPHGAGRILSRSKAKEILSLDEFRDDMKNVFTSCVGKSTLDEAPSAYKPSEDIIRCLAPMAEIIKVLKPIYNFKAH